MDNDLLYRIMGPVSFVLSEKMLGTGKFQSGFSYGVFAASEMSGERTLNQWSL